MSEGLENLLEQHKKEIWEYQQKESQWIRDKNQLDGNKQIVVELSTKLIEMGKVNLALKKRAQEAEGELSIMKGIETNRVKEAQDALANALEVNESHQKLNGKLQERLTELEEENKKMHDTLNKQLDSARKAGL